MASDPAELLPRRPRRRRRRIHGDPRGLRVGARRSSTRPTIRRSRAPTGRRTRSSRRGSRCSRPRFPVLSEEAEAAHAFAVRRDWRELWLVDPLDGTREFIGRNGEFTVNVALVRDHEPVLGVVAAPGARPDLLRGPGPRRLLRPDGESGPKPIRTRAAAGPAGRGRQPLAPRRLARRPAREARPARAAPDGQRTQVLPGRRRRRGLLPAARARRRSGTRPRRRPCSRWRAAP